MLMSYFDAETVIISKGRYFNLLQLGNNCDTQNSIYPAKIEVF